MASCRRLRGHVPYRCWTRCRRRAERPLSTAFGHLALLIQIPASMWSSASRRKGECFDRARARVARSRAGAARAWLDAYAPEAARLTTIARACRRRRRARSGAAPLPCPSRERPPARSRSGDAWQIDLHVATRRAYPVEGLRSPIARSWAEPTDPCRLDLASLDRAFVIGRATEAAGAAGATA